MTDKQRPRGRPRLSDSPERKEHVRLIGMAVFKLMHWARGNQAEVCEAVGRAAKTVLSVTDSDGLALGHERIEQFYEDWLEEENQSRKEKGWPLLPRRIDYTKESLYALAPNKVASVETLAEQILRNNGLLSYETEADSLSMHSRPERTPRAKKLHGVLGRIVRIGNFEKLSPGIRIIDLVKKQTHQINKRLRVWRKSRVKK